MTAETVLISWLLCLSAAGVIVLDAVVRGDEFMNHNKEGTDGETKLHEE